MKRQHGDARKKRKAGEEASFNEGYAGKVFIRNMKDENGDPARFLCISITSELTRRVATSCIEALQQKHADDSAYLLCIAEEM